VDARYNIGRSVMIIRRGDITRETCDAIVNAANTSLLGGGGVDGAIHRAGGPAILDECHRIVSRIGRCATGEAVITTGGNLPARYVIHTVGPVWGGGHRGEDRLLESAYHNALQIAREHGLRSVAVPSISTGAYRFPIERACRIALRAIANEIHDGGIPEVRAIVFSQRNLDVYQRVANELLRLKP